MPLFVIADKRDRGNAVNLAKEGMFEDDVPQAIAASFAKHLAAHDVLVTGSTKQRWVTHLDVGPADVERALAAVDKFFTMAVHEEGAAA